MSGFKSLLVVLRTLIINNWVLKLIAVILGTTSFYAIRAVTGIEMQYNVPVYVKVEKGFAVLGQSPHTVEVTFRGSRDDLRGQMMEGIRAVVRPKEAPSEGLHRIPIGPGNIEGAFRVTPISVRPSHVTVTFDREDQKLVAVEEPQLVGRPLVGRARVTWEPHLVSVRGPQSRLSDLASLPTEPIDVEGRVESFAQNLRILVAGERGILEVRPAEVRAKVEILTEMAKREFPNVRVLTAVPGGSVGRIVVEPPTVKVVLRGRAEFLDSLANEKLEAFVAYSATNHPVNAELPVRVALPPGKDASVEVEPPTVRVRIENAEK